MSLTSLTDYIGFSPSKGIFLSLETAGAPRQHQRVAVAVRRQRLHRRGFMDDSGVVEQQHGPNGLGWAVFYRAGDVTEAPFNDGQTLFIQFKSATDAHYQFGARWTQEGRDATPGIRDLDGFKAWLEQTTDALNLPIR